jgi:Ser/Thr protein kinase RdoA (MazF antagonist)
MITGDFQMKKAERFVEKVEVDLPLIHKVLNELKLTYSGDIQVPENGRIASNIFLTTPEKGEVMLRFYPAGCQDEKLESGFVDFEIEALTYLSSHGISVPEPLDFRQGKCMDVDGIKIFAYRLLPGESMKMSDLTEDLATKASLFLKEMLSVSEKFRPDARKAAPRGDFDYILEILIKLIQKYPRISGEPELIQMEKQSRQLLKNQAFNESPMGIVHADFFFENILIDEKTGRFSAIDFGDAYYGHIVQDILIGAMEFCVTEDQNWDLAMFKNFLKPHQGFLKAHRFAPHDIIEILQGNCLRFAIYTMPTTMEDNKPVSMNPYVARFYQLEKTSLRNDLTKVILDLYL